jgi:hypothetical protein
MALTMITVTTRKVSRHVASSKVKPGRDIALSKMQTPAAPIRAGSKLAVLFIKILPLS